MAASIGSGVRVRLNFDDSCYICESAIYKSFWFMVNLDRQKTIEGLALEICSRFDISSDLRVELSLDGCLLPRWETTAILRDNDLVTVAAVEEAGSKKRSSGNDGESPITSESNRQHKKKKKRAYEEGQEDVLAVSVDGPKKKKRRKEVKGVEVVEEDMAKCGDADGSLEKRRNGQDEDTHTDILDLSDFLYHPNSVQSSPVVRSRSCRMSSSEDLTNRLPPEQTEADGVTRNKQTPSCSFVVASASLASAVEENESQFGKNVIVSNKVTESNSQLNKVGLAANGSPDKVKKKSKRTRRSRKNRKEKNPALLDQKLKSNFNIVSPHTLEASSTDVQRRTFQWQNTDLTWSKTSANSHPQHIIFDDDDPNSGTPNEHNYHIGDVADGLLNHNVATAAAETISEGLIFNKEEVSRPDKSLSGYEPKRNCHALLHHDEQVSQFSETRHNAGNLLEPAAGEGHGSSSRLMLTTSNSRGLSHDQKPRQIRPATDLSPFTNVQVFKRQRGAKFQSSRSTAEPVLTSKGNHFPAPTYNKCQATEDIMDVRTSETTKDYSVYELLLGPPRPGDVIAYKILQLSADYSPVLSSYKEAKVQKFVPATRIVELEPKNLQIPSQLKKSTGRFDLTIEDEHEILTNSVTQDDQLISISWDLLLEPRLVA